MTVFFFLLTLSPTLFIVIIIIIIFSMVEIEFFFTFIIYQLLFANSKIVKFIVFVAFCSCVSNFYGGQHQCTGTKFFFLIKCTGIKLISVTLTKVNNANVVCTMVRENWPIWLMIWYLIYTPTQINKRMKRI